MTLVQIKYVTEVANSGSINQAAKNLYVSQSVLSTAIKSLEKELGRQIFSRSSKGITITPFGRTFLSYVTPINVQLQQLNNIIFKESGTYSASLSIASNGYHFISQVFSQLYEKYRSVGIQLKQYDVNENETAQYVANHLADIGLIRCWSCYRNAMVKQLESMKIQFFPLAALDVGITVGAENPLYHHPEDAIEVEELKAYPMIMFSHMDDGPYSDIFDRLQLQSSNNRFITSSRAAIYEILSYTDAFYLNSNYSVKPNDISYPPKLRTLVLKDCGIKSIVGWIKLSSYNPPQLGTEAINMIADILSEGSNKSL